MSVEKLCSSLIVVFACVACLCSVGCREEAAPVADKIVLMSGDNQSGLCGSELARPFVVEVLSPRIKGVLGGKGSRKPVQGVPVSFEVMSSDNSAVIAGPSEVRTDAGGEASTRLKLPEEFGSVRVRATVQTPGGPKHVTFTARSGIQIDGDDQEVVAGLPLPKPLRVTVTDTDCKPVRGVWVYFRFVGDSNKGKLSTKAQQTDSNGVAQTILTTGSKSATYVVSAEIDDPDGRLNMGGVMFHARGINRLLLLVELVGGLGLFLFGMRLMSEGLQRVAGNRLRSTLRLFTGNRFVGVTTGATLTGMIQSSSACTVMVIGFINAGLLTLQQAIGVIYGANIGTTITAQMISFKLNNLAYPAIVIGLIIQMTSKKRTLRFWGQTLLGFGLLFLGMSTMSHTLHPLKTSEWFRNFFTGFDCAPESVGGAMPLLTVFKAVLIGTAFTVVVQSSSATIGLTMALAGSGLINFYTAVPIILGDNIGTTITAILASLPANRNAKQAAAAHALFNLIGTVYMVLLFYVPIEGRPLFMWLADKVTGGSVFAAQPENIGRHIATAHSLFNIVNVLIFLPFVGTLAMLCSKIVPSRAEAGAGDGELQYLEPHLLNTPSIALDQAINEVAFMTGQSRKAIRESFKACMDASTDSAESISKREDGIDLLQVQITDYLIGLSQRPLTESEARILPMLVHAVNDAERIGDHSENLLELAGLRAERGLPFSDEGIVDAQEMHDLVQEQFQAVMDSLTDREAVSAERAIKMEARINEMAKELGRHHVKRLESGKCDIRSGVVFLDLVANLEKVGDHLTNIAERVLAAIHERENPGI